MKPRFFFGLALGKTLARINRITHTITYPPARSMLPRNRLELIDRPSPPDEATTLKFLEARAPASSFAWTIAASRFIFSLGSMIVSFLVFLVSLRIFLHVGRAVRIPVNAWRERQGASNRD